jgi:hypothetical protein
MLAPVALSPTSSKLPLKQVSTGRFCDTENRRTLASLLREFGIFHAILQRP